MALFKRSTSRYWWMKFYFDGQLIQQSTKCKNKRDAETVENAFRTELALGKIGINVTKKAPGFDAAVEDFLQWSKVEHAARSTTVDRYYFDCQILKKYFGKTKVNLIGTGDIEKFIVWRSGQISRKTKKPITRETIIHELLVLKIIFKRLFNAKILRENPALLVKNLSKNDRHFHVLSSDEEKRYLLASPQPLRDVALIMLETGMRCDEVYRVKRSEVNLGMNYLKVSEGKTKSSIRNIHLSEKARAIVEYRLNKFSGEFLFPQSDIDGEPATKTLNYLHRKTTKKLGFDFRLYDCRHTFATRAVEKGVDLLTLSSLLGHSGLDMIMRYSHPSDARKADAIKMMEKPAKRRKA